MKKAIVALLVLAAPAAALAQEGLTITDIHEAADLSITSSFTVLSGSGSVTAPAGAADIDIDLSEYRLVLRGQVGLGRGFEIEAEVPYQFAGSTEQRGTLFNPFPPPPSLAVDLEQDAEGFGDVTLNGLYRLIKESKDEPQLIVGVTGVLPVGNNDPGDPSGSFGGVPLSGDDAGIGEGVWKFGPVVGISKRFDQIEPYLSLSYVVADDHVERDDFIDDPDQITLLLGTELHVSPTMTIDVRILIQRTDEKVTTDRNTQIDETEEAFTLFALQGSVYARIGDSTTLVAGAGIAMVDDHELIKEASVELDADIFYTVQVGLHFFLKN
jgi:hypothetical protein